MELELARIQFGLTSVYHFFFVPLTLGLVIFVAIMETLYVKTGHEYYKKMTKFWGKLFLINFAIGVVTGIVMEFQFGLNWSEYSRFVGDIFGAPLAIEALLAFFLESVFLGIWIFGWDKLSKKMHLATIWLVAFGSTLSALWILIANSFMQEPVGYTFDPEQNRAEMTDFLALLSNPHVWLQFPHTVLSGWVTASFFVLGISAFHLLKNRDKPSQMFISSFKMAAIIGTISIILVSGIGHAQGQHMVRTQPMKMAAAEAHIETEECSQFSLFAIYDSEKQDNIVEMNLPGCWLSFLSHNSFSEPVEGIRNINEEYKKKYAEKYGEDADYVPPVNTVYWSFRAMVGAGSIMALLAIIALLLVKGQSYLKRKWLLRILLYAIPLPYIANTAGWMLTEIGRAPWIVFGLMRIEEGVSPSQAVSQGEVLFSLIFLALLYAVLIIIDVFLLQKYAKRVPEDA
jgi:cytochrome bd ubiquinol oxidase subunit I